MVVTLSLEELDRRIAVESNRQERKKMRRLRPFVARNVAIPATGFDGDNKRVIFLVDEKHADAVQRRLGA